MARPQNSVSARFREGAEFWALRLLVGDVGVLPRRWARSAGAAIASGIWVVGGKLRRSGLRNLEIAFPARTAAERTTILRALYRHLGWQMGEFCKMSGYTRQKASGFIRYEGLEHYLEAQRKGKGVLILTGHLGAWELSSFFHSLCGHPMSLLIRRLDNPRVDAYVNSIRCRHGNRVIHKDDFARGLLTAMHRNETVGILMDTNMTPPQGVFVPFFGVAACTASGLARVALKSGAAVVPGFLLWEPAERGYVLHFGEELELIRSGDTSPDSPAYTEQDVVDNTALFTATLERYIRLYPEQWLWVHRRWKTRPAGEGSIYQ